MNQLLLYKETLGYKIKRREQNIIFKYLILSKNKRIYNVFTKYNEFTTNLFIIRYVEIFVILICIIYICVHELYIYIRII